MCHFLDVTYLFLYDLKSLRPMYETGGFCKLLLQLPSDCFMSLPSTCIDHDFALDTPHNAGCQDVIVYSASMRSLSVDCSLGTNFGLLFVTLLPGNSFGNILNLIFPNLVMRVYIYFVTCALQILGITNTIIIMQQGPMVY